MTGQGDSKLYIDGILRTTNEKYEQVKVTIGDNELYFLIDADGDIRTSKKAYKDSDGNLVLDANKANFKFESAKGPKKGSYTLPKDTAVTE